MNQKAILGAVLAGVVVFVWGAVSHMLLGLSEANMKAFNDEPAAEQALLGNISDSGIYTIPGTRPGADAATKTAAMEKMKNGPFVFVSVKRKGMPSMVRPMIKQLLIEIVAGLLFTWVLTHTTGLSYLMSAALVAIAALAGTITTILPFWNWYGFPPGFVLSDVLDAGIGWFLGGLVIAKFARPQKT
ncbi:MAG: hypothetical protein ACREOO_02470 [bacterium]